MLLTPFHPDGEIDFDSLRALARASAERGCDGLVVLGVIAEPAALSQTEKAAIVEAVCDAVPEASLTVAAMSLDERSRASDATLLGRLIPGRIAALLVPVTAADPVMLRRNLIDVHRRSGLPLTIQDYPAATGIQIPAAALAEAIQGLDFIHSIKAEAPPTFVRIHELVQRVSVPVMAGIGGINLIDDLHAGAREFACGVSCPEVFARALQLWDAGDAQAARALVADVAPRVNFEIQPTTSIGIRKELWRRQGVIACAETRPPTRGYPAFLEGSSLAYGLAADGAAIPTRG